jgi:glycosyltransferase involved in cell wall biosynthesis
MNDIKILGVIDDPPFDPQTWSGSSYYLFSALKGKNVLCDALSAKPPKMIQYLFKGLSFQTDINKWRFKFHLNTHYYEQMTKAALQQIKRLHGEAAGYNVILQIGAWYDLTKRDNALTVSYHDGNLHALLNSPFGYPKISRKVIERALKYEKRLYEKIDLIFPMSKWLANSFIKDFEVSAKKLLPVGAGINLPYILGTENRDYDRPNLLFVGKQFERKGGKFLIEAFNIAKREVRDLTLTIIGPHLTHLPDGIRCLNFLSKNTREGVEQLLSEYASASVFVMPSLYEPFGIVFAEAMAHRLPCIGTNICAIPELIENGVNGYVVPVSDSAALAKRMIDLLKNPEMCRQMGNRGYMKYLKNYTWDEVTNKMIAGMKERG